MNVKHPCPQATAPRAISLSGQPGPECVISLATANTGFPKRLARLHQSLVTTGFTGDLLAWTPDRYPEDCPTHQDVPFAFKPFCFGQVRRERQLVLWMDASCIAVRSLDPLFQRIATHGYLLFKNGRHKVGEWSSDDALAFFGMSREEAMGIDEVYAAAIGLDLSSPIANRFLDLWHDAARAGLPFRGVKEPLDTTDDYSEVKWNRGGRVSADPRVRGHRHDQTVAGILASRLGMTLTPTGLQPYPREGTCEVRKETMIMIDRYEINPCPAEPNPILGSEG